MPVVRIVTTRTPRDPRSGRWSTESLKSPRAGKIAAPIVVGLAICVVLAVLFGFVARLAVRDGGRNDVDIGWALEMKEHSEQHPWIRTLMVGATHLGGVPFMTGIALVGAVWFIARRQRELAIAWIAISAGGGALNLLLKDVFDRERPPLEWRDSAVVEVNESFPSGHSMGSLIGYGLLAYMATLRRTHRLRTILILVVAGLIVVTIGFSRIYLRAHWFTDVAGGFLVGGAWLALCLGFVETFRPPIRVVTGSEPASV